MWFGDATARKVQFRNETYFQVLYVHSLPDRPCAAFKADGYDFIDLPELPDRWLGRCSIRGRILLPLLVLHH